HTRSYGDWSSDVCSSDLASAPVADAGIFGSLQEERMSQSVVTPQRFAKGMTFDEYVKYVGTPENLAREGFSAYHPDAGSIGGPRKDNSAVFRERYARTKLADYQVAAIKWLAAQPDGPAKNLV